jgi:signal transduction histidine kinase
MIHAHVLHAVTVSTWAEALAALAGVLVAVAVLRGTPRVLAMPLALMGIDQFVWNLANVALDLGGDERWHWLSAVSAPFLAPLALQFVLGFTGSRRKYRWVQALAWVVFTARALGAVIGWAVPDRMPGMAVLSFVFLFAGMPFAAFGFWGLSRYLRTLERRSAEASRTRLLIAALAIALPLLWTHLLRDLGQPVPSVSYLGAIIFTAALTYIALGAGKAQRALHGCELLGSELLGRVLLAALFITVGYLGVVGALAQSVAMLVLGVTAMTLAAVVIVRMTSAAGAAQREGLQRFATLGRFSAQMAHDLKNPLAVALGYVDFLRVELKAGRRIDDPEPLDHLKAALDRTVRVVDRYQRLSKIEPQRSDVDLTDLVDRIVSLQRYASPGVEISRMLDAPGAVALDADLVGTALENLVKNAVEATPRRVRVTTQHHNGWLTISVEDDGSGMDARNLESAFELFHTTKATGSGMGLAFVREVARAHGGDATVRSRPGRGTRVEMSLKLEAWINA